MGTRSPIEMMVDEACGYDGQQTNEEREEGEQAFADLCLKAAEACEKINPEHPEKVATEIGEAIELLREAERQIEYLHRKFKPTGTGENVLAKLRALLSRIDTDKEQGT